jgi:hypothetical protein
VQELQPPDTHHVSAALGWLELGNRPESKVELARVHPEWRDHADVQEVWWMIHAEEQDWHGGLAASRKILQSDPGRVTGWLHQAYALRRVRGGGLESAWAALLPATKLFPKEATIPYNLACYACQLDRLEESRLWFNRALKIGGKTRMKTMALADEDLKPLWEEIQKL